MDAQGELTSTVGAQYETDKNFALVAARSLDRFVKEGILTPADIRNAPPEAYDEFALRILVKERLNHEITQKDKNKLQGYFRSEHRLLMENPPSKEEIVANVRLLLQKMQIHNPSFGIILYGSSMDPTKKLRVGSDVDGIRVLKRYDYIKNYEDEFSDLSGEEIVEDETERSLKYTLIKYQDELKFFNRLPIEIGGILEDDDPIYVDEPLNKYGINKLLAHLGEPKSTLVGELFSFPFWGWNSDALQFVSADPDVEEEFQEKLTRAFHDPNVYDRRKRYLQMLKEDLLREMPNP